MSVFCTFYVLDQILIAEPEHAENEKILFEKIFENDLKLIEVVCNEHESECQRVWMPEGFTFTPSERTDLP
jgi:hypothetical protein